MTDDANGEERDPLLVRPFVLRDSGTSGAGATTPGPAAAEPAPTWPAAASGEEGAPDAGDAGDDPTRVLLLPQARRPRDRRRTAVLAAAAGVVVLGAAATGYAALRTDVRPSLTTALPGALPAATAPPSTAGATGSAPAATTPSSASPAASRSASASASPSATPSAGASTGAATSATPAPLITSTAPAGGATGTPRAPAAVAPPAGDRTGVLRGQNGLCLDLNGFVVFDGNHVQVYDCNGSGAQLWTLASDGTLRVGGKCAYVVGDNTVHIVGCDGRTPAQWRVDGQQLVNAANSRCLTDPSGGGRSGTGVTVTDCDGSARQRWSLP